MFKPKLSELFLASFKFEGYNPLQTKILLLNAILFITALTNLFFGIYNLFIIKLYSVSVINFSILILISYAIYILREKEDHHLAAYIGNAILFIGFVVLVLNMHGENFTLIWTFFSPPLLFLHWALHVDFMSLLLL